MIPKASNLDAYLHGPSRHIQRVPRLTDCLVSADKNHSHPGSTVLDCSTRYVPLHSAYGTINPAEALNMITRKQTCYRSKARETAKQVDWHGKQVTSLAAASRPIPQLRTDHGRKPTSTLIRSHYLSRLSPGIGTASCGALHASDESEAGNIK